MSKIHPSTAARNFVAGLSLLATLSAAPAYRVTRVEGRVFWVQADQKERRPALPGTPLAAGDLLVALEGGSCLFSRESGPGAWWLGPRSAARMAASAGAVGPACLAGSLHPVEKNREGEEGARAENRAGAAP
ncbi:MAG: hypothetical protein J0L75_05865 [Spirochaetes bacterium]|nr:hypothetical protein [Spirochaetota bacterium]